MQSWYHIIPKNTGLSAFAWIIFCLLPFYFVFRSSSTIEIVLGIIMILLFFGTYRISFLSRERKWTVYLSVSINILISMVMTIIWGFVYFSLFLAFYIGNIQHRGGFISLYVVHLVFTIFSVAVSVFTQSEIFTSQLPFIGIAVIGVILLPPVLHHRNKRERLEEELEAANEKISRLVVIEERERIARDLHDTLGQKLSLIGLKSDLAAKLINTKPEAAKAEIGDIHQTARTALKEVREMVSSMKGSKLTDEILRVKELLKAAGIECHLHGELELHHSSLLIENVLSMCLREAVNNVAKHSNATVCHIVVVESPAEVSLRVRDDGKGMGETTFVEKNGIRGMKERLEFVNGKLSIREKEGTLLDIQVPISTGKE
ncbi:histidine kinase [Virgibacillus xinjiangensis]|uniref:histidine kinase n=1 Tax=Virgibacillus xinjiangensis TaxID=393090 RepID=A0ABV7CXM8_9BACI